jgi:hypothetical protein
LAGAVGGRGGAPSPAVIELVGMSKTCPSDHCLMRGVHESKEEVGGVLTERKMKTLVDQGQLVVRKGGRLLPMKFGDESWVARGPNKGEMVWGKSLPCSGARQRVKSGGGSSEG